MTEPTITRQAYDGDQPEGVVSFREMQHGTADDYALLDRYERLHAGGLADRLLDTLSRLTDSSICWVFSPRCSSLCFCFRPQSFPCDKHGLASLSGWPAAGSSLSAC